MERKTELDARLMRFYGNISERRIFSIKWQKSTQIRLWWQLYDWQVKAIKRTSLQ